MRDTTVDRLYRLLPEHVRARDADEGRPLQALMQILGRELEVVEGDMDTLYDNWFIETCEDWVVQYIGDLVGTRALRGFGQGALRAYVANTLTYRQAKGTLAVLEQLARDVTGWPAIGAEFFHRLIQTQSVNRVRLNNLATASLRDADAASLTGGPFETAAHSVDVRDIGTDLGRYNIPNVGLFVWRVQSYDLQFLVDPAKPGYLGGVVPGPSTIGHGFRYLDPVGRPLTLFNRARTERSVDELTAEPAVPAPLRRRRIASDLDGMRAGKSGAGVYFLTRPVFAVRLDGTNIAPQNIYCCNLEDPADGGDWNRPAAPGKIHFDPEFGRLSLHPSDEDKHLEVAYAFGAPHDIGAGPADRRKSVGAWIEPFTAVVDGAAPLWQIGVTRRTEDLSPDPLQPVVATLAAAIELWNARSAPGRRGIIAILDSATYAEDLSDASHHIKIPEGAMLGIVAAGWPADLVDAGPVKRTAGELTPQGRRPHVASSIHVLGIAQTDATPGTLILDGLLLQGSVAIEDGDLGRVELRHCTVGAGPTGLGAGLSIPVNNARLGLIIDHAIVGAIHLGDAAGTISIKDSIIGEDRVADGDPAASPVVVDAKSGDLVIARTTVFGRLIGRTIEGDDSIFVGPINIARRQSGCVRFSYVREDSRSPRRFRCAPDLQIAKAKEELKAAFMSATELAIRQRVQPVFTATVTEHFAFGQLARCCPPEIAEGGEGGTEMGAMNSLFNPMRLANIKDALDEYLPFGISAGVIFET